MRLGTAYPAAAERLDAEEIAAAALRKAKKDDESMARRGYSTACSAQGPPGGPRPGEPPGRSPGLTRWRWRGWPPQGFHSRGGPATPPGDRRRVLALYDGLLGRFPSSPKAEEVAYQRAWPLRGQPESGSAARLRIDSATSAGSRGEAAWYMAVQCAKDLSSPQNPEPQAEVTRLAREYERAFPDGERLFLVRLDRARAHFLREEWDHASVRRAKRDAAPEPLRSAVRVPRSPGRRTLRRVVLCRGGEGVPGRPRRRTCTGRAGGDREMGGFSMFRTAERLPVSRGGEAAPLFLRIVRNSRTSRSSPKPGLGREPPTRTQEGTPRRSLRSSRSRANTPLRPFFPTRRAGWRRCTRGREIRWRRRNDRAALDAGGERRGKGPAPLPRGGTVREGEGRLRSRRAYAMFPLWLPPPRRCVCPRPFRAGESALAEEGKTRRKRMYESAVRLHREKGGVAPEVAGRALLQRAEIRYRAYVPYGSSRPWSRRSPGSSGPSRGARIFTPKQSGSVTPRPWLRPSIESGRGSKISVPRSSPRPTGGPLRRGEGGVRVPSRRTRRADRGARRGELPEQPSTSGGGGPLRPLVGKSRERLRALRPALFAKTGVRVPRRPRSRLRRNHRKDEP